MLEVREWTVEEHIHNKNALAYVAETLSLSPKEMKIILNYHLCGINQRMVSEESTVSAHDLISCTIPDHRPSKDIPYDYPLDILFEDDSVLVINKPNDMAVIPGPDNWSENIYLALLHYYGKEAYFRIAHRIDKCTTGCLLITKIKKATKSIARQTVERTCRKEYRALVKGAVTDAGKIELPIGRDPQNFRRMGITEEGKYALSEYAPLEQMRDATELRVWIKTGRTHQIRVHLAAIGHPLIGDDVYGEPFSHMDTKGAVLHAAAIRFNHPVTGEAMLVEAPVPEYYQKVKSMLSGKL